MVFLPVTGGGGENDNQYVSGSGEMRRLIYGLFGFFIGGVATLAILAGLADSINWVAVGIVSVVSAALSAVFGLKFLSWLEEILRSW